MTLEVITFMVGNVGNSNNSIYTNTGDKVVGKKTTTTNTTSTQKTDIKPTNTTTTTNNPPNDKVIIKNNLTSKPTYNFEPTFDLCIPDATFVTKKQSFTNLKDVQVVVPMNFMETGKSIDVKIKEISDKYFKDGKIMNSKVKEFEKDMQKLLSNNESRKELIQLFKLDSNVNEKHLLIASALESDDIKRNCIGCDEQKIKENVFPVASAILNRALGNNLLKAAAYQSKTNSDSLKDFKPISIYSIVTEAGQFSISPKFKSITKNLEKKDVTKNENLKINKEVVDNVLNGTTKFKIGDKEFDSSNMFFFQNKAISTSNTTYGVAFKSPNNHVFSTYSSSKQMPYAVFSSFSMKSINWNQ